MTPGGPRILLTGRDGQLGRALLPVLSGSGDLSAFAKAEFDLSSEKAMASVLDRADPQLIVNAAAYTAVDQAETDTAAARAVNSAGPGFLARWAESRGAAMVHYSTDYVFSGDNPSPYRETDATHPVNAYGASKLAGEEAIRASGARHLIIRTSWLYDGSGRNFLTTIGRLASEREELRVVDDQVGAPTSAGWLADTTGRILNWHWPGSLFDAHTGGVLHAATAGATSWHGFAEAIVEGMRQRGLSVATRRVIPIPSAECPVPAKRPRNSIFDLGRLQREFAIEPPDWTVALSSVLDEYSAALRGR